MGKYNFEKDDKQFSETVRLDYLNEEVRKTETMEETAEFQPVKRQNTSARKELNDDVDDIIPLTKVIRYSVIGGLIIFIFIFVVVMVNYMGGRTVEKGTINENNISDAVNKSDSLYAIVLSSNKKKELRIYNINEKKHMSLNVTDETEITGANGGIIGFGELRAGDIILVEEGENGTVKEIRVPHDIWRQDSVKGVTVNLDNNTILYNGNIYSYGDDTFFVYNDVSMFPGDISKSDTVTIIGKENMVFSVRLEVGHGVLLFKNYETIQDIKVMVDDVLLEIDLETGIAEIGSGSHKLTISGKDIDDYTTAINVEDKSKITIDLADATVEADEGSINLKVDQTGYTVLVDGINYTESLTDIVVTKGIHKIEIIKTGFEKWSTTLDVGTQTVELNVKLKPSGVDNEKEKVGNLTVYSQPGWAKIYIDGAYVGVSPVMAGLKYGEHYIEAELEGYEKFKTHVTIDSPDKTVTANFN